jgi:S1-C subfamily serine protease
MRAFLLACLALLPSAALAWDLDQVKLRAEENNVQVGDGCSGTIVSVEHGLVLTAYHCITDAIKVEAKPERDGNGEVIIGPDGKPKMRKEKLTRQVPLHQFFWDKDGEKSGLTVYADIVARNDALDVAILKIPAKVGPVAVSTAARTDVPLLAKGSAVPVGATVWHIGNPMMMYGSVTRGIYSANRSLADFGMDGVKMYVQYDGGLTGGSSGGALYDDAGNYVGIAVMVAPSATFLGLAVPMADVWQVAADACIADQLGGENAAKCKKPEPVKPVTDR